MQKSTKKITAACLTSLSVLAVVAVCSMSIDFSFSKSIASEAPYSLEFSSSQRVFSSSESETTTTVNTSMGNPIGFTYSGLTSGSNVWETMSDSGYFYNTTALTGIETITFVFDDAGSGVVVSYGFSTSNYEVSTTITESTTYDFDSEKPSYFKVEANGAAVSITSMSVTYSCEEDDRLAVATGSFTRNSLASWTSNEQALGVIEGKTLTTGTISATLTKGSSSDGDSGLVFCLSNSDLTSYWEGEGVSYYFLLVTDSGLLILGKTDNGNWTSLVTVTTGSVSDTYEIKATIAENGLISGYANGTLLFEYLDTAKLTGTKVGLRAVTGNTTFSNVTVSTEIATDSLRTSSWIGANGSLSESEGVLTTTSGSTLAYASDMVVEENVRYETSMTQGTAQDAGMVIGVKGSVLGWESGLTYYTYLINSSGLYLFASIDGGTWTTLVDNNNIKTYSATTTYKLGIELVDGVIKCYVDDVLMGTYTDSFDVAGGLIGVRAATSGCTFTNISSRTTPTVANEWYQRSGTATYDESTDTLTALANGTLLWNNTKTFGPGQTLTITQTSSAYGENGIVFGCSDKTNTRWEEYSYYFLDITTWTTGLSKTTDFVWIDNSANTTGQAANASDGNVVQIVWTLDGDYNHFVISINGTQIYDLTDSTYNLQGSYFGVRSASDFSVTWTDLSVTDNA